MAGRHSIIAVGRPITVNMISTEEYRYKVATRVPPSEYWRYTQCAHCGGVAETDTVLRQQGRMHTWSFNCELCGHSTINDKTLKYIKTDQRMALIEIKSDYASTVS